MQVQDALSCPKCEQKINTSFVQHYSQVCPHRNSLDRVSETVAKFIDQTYVCGRCYKIFQQKEWDNHQRKIRQKCQGFSRSIVSFSTPLKSQIDDEDRQSERVYSQPSQKRLLSESKSKSVVSRLGSSSLQERIYGTSLFSERQMKSERIAYTKEITKDEQILLHLMNLLQAKSKIPLHEWIKQNTKIKSIYLQQFFEKFLQKTLRRLSQIIKVPDFDMLEKSAPLKWKLLLKNPDDIFNEDIILNSLKDVSKTRKNRVLAALNKIYKSFYQDVFKKFEIQNITPKAKRNEYPLQTKQFFKVLEELMMTKERDLVHIGIDLYLIFQSGQRSKSDRQNIVSGIDKLLKDRKDKQQYCVLEMDIKKTKKSGRFILSEQLCQLLEQFEWKGFYKNGLIYQRMRKIFGFPVYSIKSCLFSQFQLQKAKFSNIRLQNLANHASLKVSLGYAKDGVEINEKTIKDNLCIPNLKVCYISRGVLYRFLGRRPHWKKHIVIKNDWLQRLRKKLGNYDKTQCDFYESLSQIKDNSLQGSQISEEINKTNNMQQPQKQLKSQQKKKANLLKEDVSKVRIRQIDFSFKERRFKFDELFLEQMKISYCLKCSIDFSEQAEGFSCIFCTAQYHTNCLPKFCFCICKHQQLNGVPSSCGKKNKDLHLKMPNQYFQHKNQDKLDQIIFLLAARGFRFTNIAVCESNVFIDEKMVKEQNVQRVVLPNFEEYQKGSYFPPLTLNVSGQTTASGTSFGLFAAEDIEEDCFIGQYAADIINAIDYINFRRIDSVFDLVNGTRPTNKILIGPIKRCGYVLLINGSKPQEANCASKKVQINGYLRLIIYTIKRISKGTQLCYNYSINSVFSAKGLSKAQQPKKSLQTKPNIYRRCGLANLGQSCYMNSVFQFLKILLFNQMKNQPLFSLLLKNLIEKQQYNPKRSIEFILGEINKNELYFSTSQQSDAHQFLVKCLQTMGEQVKKKITGEFLQILKCNSCGRETNNLTIFTTLEVEMPNEIAVSQILTKQRVENVTYKCLQCGSQSCQKTTSIIKLPDVLIICFKRFQAKFSQTHQKVQLSKNQKEIAQIDSFENYSLQAVIVHIGDQIKRGHYITEQYLKDQVCIIDDTEITIVQKNTQSSKGYIFGYNLNAK